MLTSTSFSRSITALVSHFGYYNIPAFILTAFVLSCNREGESKARIEDESLSQYYHTGKIQAEFSMKNGRKDGMGKIYYLNGKLSSECNYRNGVKNGTENKYYSDGALYRTREYKNGQLEGIEKRFYRSGNLKTILSYKQEMPGTDLVEFYSNGTKVSKYAEFKHEIILNRDYQEQKLLILYFDGITEKVHFYRGALEERKYFDVGKMPCGISDGKGEIAISPDFQGEIIISAKYVTPFRAPYVLEKKIRIED